MLEDSKERSNKGSKVSEAHAYGFGSIDHEEEGFDDSEDNESDDEGGSFYKPTAIAKLDEGKKKKHPKNKNLPAK